MACMAHADIIIANHQGNANPTTEGWNEVMFVNAAMQNGLGSVSVSPVSADMGFDAWEIDDASSLLGANGGYSRNITPSEVADATAKGWRLSTRLKSATIPDDGSGGSIIVGFHSGPTRWRMAFGSQADGDPTVQLLGGSNPVHVIDGAGAGYHLYELVFDPLSGSADLSVDGNEVLTNYIGGASSDSTSFVYFGSQNDNDTGRGRYSSVQFSVVPESSAFLHLAIAACACVCLRSILL